MKPRTVKPPNSGPQIPMPNPCIDCGKAWSMFQSEKDWWDKEGPAQGLKFPRRCEACREARRNAAIESKPVKHDYTAANIAEELRTMATGIFNREYASQEDDLSKQLMEIASRVVKLDRQQKEMPLDQTPTPKTVEAPA